MSGPEHVRRFELALGSKAPGEELHRLAVSLRDEGVSQIELYALFEQFLIATSGEGPGTDVIPDTMDLIAGGPWSKGRDLFEAELTAEQIHEHRKRNDHGQS
jgi:hypothetical protein